MTTKEFLPVAQKLIKTGLFLVLKPQDEGQFLIGCTCIGFTDNQNERLWRNHGSLHLIVLDMKASDVNNILKFNGISEFKAVERNDNTKSSLILA